MTTQLSTAAIAIFFKSYNSPYYTYDPTLAVDDEFLRLQHEQQWGPEEVQEHRRLLYRAVQLAHFFWKHEWGGYAFREDAEYDHEFWRLCEKKRWDEGRISRAVDEFLKLSGGSVESLTAAGHTMPEETAPEEEAEAIPEQEPETTFTEQEDAETVHPEDPEAPGVQSAIAVFFVGHSCPGYTYAGRSPRTEFRNLIGARRRAWRAHDPDGTFNQDFQETEEFRTLDRDYHEAVEERFDGLLGMRGIVAGGYAMRPWESILELFRLGDIPISKNKASKLIKRIYVNIYDFLEFLEESNDSSTAEWHITGDEEYERACLLRHRSRGELAQYSRNNGKVYPLKMAKEDGTLALFLQPLWERAVLGWALQFGEGLDCQKGERVRGQRMLGTQEQDSHHTYQDSE
ncbi:unnamed protein product [Tuber melanosporum]|uniref:(Perigord truffle) hypothetical protein n=1 Tax=Tuber melanosporum (strain Mel28) TaxID=656061 RepID=D5GCS7_TUBMM|nr:uncharacterized protein GSTUM_00006000001 [Tuber melanosporum]CAZ82320.1 unnamed protein product [Tuber melanosporum]